ncbi:MAG: HAD family hydrolase [SAR324 cluster bacterium]|nr:HAD family hydrolase [SAR324 cluster bacterium]
MEMTTSFKDFLDQRQYLHYQAGIFDLDNTLYAYAPCNQYAQKQLFERISLETGFPVSQIDTAYKTARTVVHNRLSGTAAMHSRFLYIQTMLESLHYKTMVDRTLQLHEFFWGCYFSKMKLFEWVLPLFNDMRAHEIKIAILTDLTAEVQFRKLQKLGILPFIEWVITSEEVGAEKPHQETIDICLKKLNKSPENLFFVGDDPKKDTVGEILGIQTILFNYRAEGS